MSAISRIRRGSLETTDTTPPNAAQTKTGSGKTASGKTASGKTASGKTASGKKQPAGEDPEVGKQRRRLSVVSCNTLVEGFSELSTEEETVGLERSSDHCISSYAGISKKGYAPYNPRKKNQDALIMEEHAPTNSLLLCVYDGHGEQGDIVSHFLQKHFPKALFDHPSFKSTGDLEKDAEGIMQAIKVTQAELEKKLLNDRSVDTDFSGTTAVVSVVRGNMLVVGNVGDSRITCGTRGSNSKIMAKAVSDDHKPDRSDEKARILKAGGRVFAVEYDDGIDGPPRVWLGNMDVPGLAMSRSLCDAVAHSAGVSSEPEFFVKHLEGQDEYLVLASDGLWEFMSDQEVMDIVEKYRDNEKKCVDVLAEESSSRWMREEQVIDDTTIIVAKVSAQ